MDAAERAATELTDEARGTALLDESPVFFQSGDDVLLGMFTRPLARPLDVALISAAGGLRGTSMGRNRLMVRLSRQAGRRGFHGFRFDYHGVGESTGPIESFSLDAPYSQDLEAAAREVERLGIERHLFAGVCFGARTVMSVAPSHRGLVGVALVEPPIRDGTREGRKHTRYGTGKVLRAAVKPWVLAGLFKAEQRAYYAKYVKAKIHAAKSRDEQKEATDLSWVSEHFLATMRQLIDRRVPVLLIYGEGSENYREFRRAQSGKLGALMGSAGTLIETVTLPGQIHGFSDLLSQQRVIDTIEGWACSLFEANGVGSQGEGEDDA